MREKLLPGEIWHGMHEKGDSADASDAAANELAAIDTKGFTDRTVAHDHAEYARIAFVTALSAVKKSKDWTTARTYLQRAVNIAGTTYPFAETAELARLKGTYWEGEPGSESAQLQCVRDVLGLSKLLYILYPTQEILDWLVAVESVLTSIAEENSERHALIFVIENGAYGSALLAYKKYKELHGTVGRELYSAEETSAVTTRMMGRAVDAGDFRTLFAVYVDLGTVALKKPSLKKFIFVELIKNHSAVFKDRFIARKLAKWRDSASEDTQTLAEISELLRNKYIGLGGSTTSTNDFASV
jgi:hypothetical protein